MRPAARQGRAASWAPRSRTLCSSAASSITSSTASAAAATSGAAGEGRAVVARREHVAELGRGDERTDRQTASPAAWPRSSRRVARRSPATPTACRCGPCRTGSRRRSAPPRSRRRPRARRAGARRRGRGSRPRPGPARAARPPCRSSTAARSASSLPAAPRGSRARAARTAPAWTPAASPTARRRCARGRRRCTDTTSPPGRRLRASLSAASTASAPELVKNTLPPSERAASRPARRSEGSV